MKLIFILLTLFAIGFVSHEHGQQKYLPVSIVFRDTTNIPDGLLLNLKAMFGVRKIKTLTKKDIEDLIYREIYSVSEEFHKIGGNILDGPALRRYQSTHMRKVGNTLTIDIKIDAAGYINDTVRFDSYTIPIDMLNFPKTKWKTLILNRNNASNMLQMSQSIVDSIIASNVLVKE